MFQMLCSMGLSTVYLKKVKQTTLPVENKREKLDITWVICVGTTMLNRTEHEIWRMTYRKFFELYIMYLKINGKYQAPLTIDDVIPF